MNWQHDVQTLPSGVRVAFAPVPAAEGVSIGAYIPTGSRHETLRLNGISHFIEHLLFKGTRRRSARAIAESVEGCGGSFDAFTQEDLTCYHARVPAERQDEVLDVLLDMLAAPRFDPVDLERERAVILEEIAMYRDQPAQRADELLQSSLWPGHALGRPITGTPASLKRIERSEVIDWWSTHYHPSRIVFAFSGAIDREGALRRLRRMGQGRRAGVVRPRPAKETPLRRPTRFAFEGRETDQGHISLAYRTFGRRDPRRYALRLLSVLAGETGSSRLFQQIREQRGWAYSVSTQAHLMEDTGAFSFEAGVDPSRVQACLRMVDREFARLREKGPSAAEVRRARDWLIGQMRLALESPVSRLGWVGEQLALQGRILEPDRVIAAIARLEASDLRETARTGFRNDRRAVVVVGPSADQDELSAVGSSFAGSD